MDKTWNDMTPAEQVAALRVEMDDVLKTMMSMQNDLAGLMRRFIELQTQQNSTYGLVHEVVASFEKIESRA